MLKESKQTQNYQQRIYLEKVFGTERDKEFFRQAKAKGLHHHLTGLSSNV